MRCANNEPQSLLSRPDPWCEPGEKHVTTNVYTFIYLTYLIHDTLFIQTTCNTKREVRLSPGALHSIQK